MTHWTKESTNAFIRRITFDFWTQIQKHMDTLPLTQFELAKTLGVSESAISQVLNNSQNPQLKTLVTYAKALGLNVALVPYRDDDPHGRPVNSEIFTICWDRAGKPRTFGAVEAAFPANKSALTESSIIVPVRRGYYISGRRAARTQERGLGFVLTGIREEGAETALNEAQIRDVPQLRVGGVHG